MNDFFNEDEALNRGILVHTRRCTNEIIQLYLLST